MIVCSKPYECKHYPTGVVCAICENGERFCPRTMTRADRLRSMTDEELARYLCPYRCPSAQIEYECAKKTETEERDCKKCWLDWLKQEVDDDNHDH